MTLRARGYIKFILIELHYFLVGGSNGHIEGIIIIYKEQ